MSVSTGTLTVKQMVFTANRKLFCTISATGDATGGVVSFSKDLKSYIPNKSDVIIENMSTQCSETAQKLGIYTQSGQWERNVTIPLLSYKATREGTFYHDAFAMNMYTQGKACVDVPMPFWLGMPLGDTANIFFTAVTNTDGKAYTWYLDLVLIPKYGNLF